MSKTILLNHSNWHFTKENTGIPAAVMGEAAFTVRPSEAVNTAEAWYHTSFVVTQV